jgi:hypothetical protein
MTKVMSSLMFASINCKIHENQTCISQRYLNHRDCFCITSNDPVYNVKCIKVSAHGSPIVTIPYDTKYNIKIYDFDTVESKISSKAFDNAYLITSFDVMALIDLELNQSHIMYLQEYVLNNRGRDVPSQSGFEGTCSKERYTVAFNDIVHSWVSQKTTSR